MKKIIFIFLCLSFLSCGPPFKYGDIRDESPKREAPKFSDDPLLDSIMWYRYQDCLRNCAEKDCD